MIFITLSVTICSSYYSLDNILQQKKWVISTARCIVIHQYQQHKTHGHTICAHLVKRKKKIWHSVDFFFFSCTQFKCLVLKTTWHMNTTVLIEIQELFIQICTTWQTFSDMLIPSVSCQRLSCSGKDEVLCFECFSLNKSQVQNKKAFLFLKCFFFFLLFAVKCFD